MDQLHIEKTGYHFTLDDAAGSLTSFSNGKKQFIAFSGEVQPLFTIRFRDSVGNIIDIHASDFGSVDIVNEVESAAERIFIRYTQLETQQITATVTIHCPKNSSLTYWNIAVDHETDWLIEWIDFPKVVVPNDLTATGGTGKIIWPGNEGVLVEDVNIRESTGFRYIEPNYPSRGVAGIYPAAVPTQFMAYYCDEGGLYFGAHDDQGHVKVVEYFPDENGICLQFRLYPGVEGNGSWKMSYDMVLGVFEGDWHNAADIYRDWYLASTKYKAVPIEENPNLPEWYKESPVIIAYPVRGKQDMDTMEPNKLFPYVQALPHLEKLAESFDSKVMALLMHWEGTAPWAPPYVWPPYGGEEALKEFSDRLHDSGHLLGVYCSGIGWTEQSHLIPEYNRKEQFDRENLAEIMCSSPTGELPYSDICTGQRSGYDMCPSQDFTVDVVAKEVKDMIEGGCDYIQLLDQNHGGTSYFCYSKTHGHPPVPGKWQTDAMTGLYDRLQEVADQAGKKVIFGCESAAAEPFIPGLLFSDLRLTINYFIGTPIPIYQYLYHEFVNNFMGNQHPTQGIMDFENSPNNLLYRLAYSFNAGDMMTVSLKDDGDITWSWGTDWNKVNPDQQAVADFIQNANSWRKGMGKPYLLSGRMLKPYAVQAQTDEIHMLDGRLLKVPTLLTSRWTAKDGSEVQFVINYAKEAQAFTIDLSSFAGRPIKLRESADAQEEITVLVGDDGILTHQISALQTIWIRLV
ncbi:DUF6259 domain-containing protein [Cohnella abietis]|uniref:DUF6259 domain-containing protein n=1 Tax=Cohnella abietis TaxID=2507935 RepID=UPI00102EB1BA|nr:DUF6259 domain-containing protein [Cohnella abietis]